MFTAIVLLKAEVHSIPETGQAIAELPAVSEVYSVAGPWDLVAVVRVSSQEDLGHAIANQIDKIRGVTASETLVGLQVFSRHDLDRLFSLGFEGEGVAGQDFKTEDFKTEDFKAEDFKTEDLKAEGLKAGEPTDQNLETRL